MGKKAQKRRIIVARTLTDDLDDLQGLITGLNNDIDAFARKLGYKDREDMRCSRMDVKAKGIYGPKDRTEE